MKADSGSAGKRKLNAGDRVRFRLGIETEDGVIVEDRGLIGAGRRRLWGIEFFMDQYQTEPSVIELPEVDILDSI